MTRTLPHRSRSLVPLLGLAWALLVVVTPGCGRHAASDEPAKGADEKAGEAKSAADSNRVVLPAGGAQAAGLTVANAGPATIDVTVQLPGEVKPDSGRVLLVRPRFAGVVHALQKQIGDPVQRGETVATIQSNESLTDYAVTAAMPGRVMTRGATIGQTVSQDTPLYTIVDLSDVWVEFAIYPHQLGQIRRGQAARVAPQSATGLEAKSTISYVGPMLAQDTRVSVARVVLPNPERRWDPGLFVTVTVVTDHANVAVAVPDEAVLRMTEGQAVFVPERGGYTLRRVVTGRSDGRTTQIVSGLTAGTPVVVHNAFVLKSELEKAEYEE